LSADSRTWIEFPYGEEEITLLEEEVLPAIQQCLQRVDAIDAALQEEQEARIAVEQLRQQLAAVAEGSGGLEEPLPV
jgi:ABC-type hemin transport system substrate-binding protein